MKVCILDAGPLIHLDQLSAIPLLKAMGTLFCPAIVAREAEFHRPGVLSRADFIQVVDGPAVPSATMPAELPLHAGELAGLAWAEKFGADIFLSDDMAARTAAERMGLEVCGSIGVILRAVDEGHIGAEAASDLLRQIPENTTLHISAVLLASAVEKLR